MSDDRSANVTHGEFLHRGGSARGQKEAELAVVLGTPVQRVNDFLNGKRAISAEMSRRLAAVFDAPVWRIRVVQKEWEAKRELSRAPEPPPSDLRRARVIGVYPVREMV